MVKEWPHFVAKVRLSLPKTLSVFQQGIARLQRIVDDPGRTGASCISPALQLKREWSPRPEFGSDPENPRDLSKG
jgi:hypothetical protein